MRFFTHIEFEFEAPDAVGEPKYQGDAPIDYGHRALDALRPALEALRESGAVDAYCILGPRRCECIALPLSVAGHGDQCRAEDPRAADMPPPTITVVQFGRRPAPEEDE